MKLLKLYVKEHISQICLYAGMVGIVTVILFLYNIPLDCVQYILLLCLFWAGVYAAAGMIRYKRRYQSVFLVKQGAAAELSGLPEPATLIEEEYQKIIALLSEEKIEIQSRANLARQDMMDYYGMWVHQIKTPIAAMNVLLQSGDKEETGCEKELRMELFKIEQYVEMVLTYLRMEDMSADLAFERCDLDEIIRQAVRKYSRMFILKKIQLNYEPVNKTVLTDEKWIVFVLEQILSNALKYTGSGSISIYMEGKELVIADTGIGIWSEDLPRIFEKGFTGYNGRSDKKSTGIGLYLCKSIIDKLRHQIRVESEAGAGTKVYLYLERNFVRTES